ncbi:MAG TPA: class I tRNA ligase family protein [Acidimicrobiia bacterium]|nr:class I tRNA ligase family protein [Acidimicrobiia bacterium]
MSERGADVPKFRYTAALANEIEAKWQDRWEAERTFWAPNPTGPLADGFEKVAGRRKLFVLDMFPYPSGVGLHVGHPLGYIGTDVYARFKRMTEHNVLHAMGYDAFGLPAEQYAVQTGQHPRVTTEQNIETMKRQLRALGLGHDPRRGVATTDVPYYRWTQWIFLQIFNSWYDTDQGRARPVDDLVAEFEAGIRTPPDGAAWDELDELDRRRLVDSYRLAYLEEAPVNWCPALGTVLANEEVTPDGRSERGNHPVYKRPLRQWMMRITAYAERLLADLDVLDWPEPIKIQQRNWIGRSTGADIVFSVEGHEGVGIRVFTTRPDTVFGATYMVLAPELDLVDEIVANEWPPDTPAVWRATFGTDVSPAEAVTAYRNYAATKTDVERQAEGREKTGVFIGAFATNPATGESIPIFIADYVLATYGTGAIMAVPGQDERDWDFAQQFDLPIVRTVQPPPDFDGEAYLGDGPAINSGFLDGLYVAEAKERIIEWLEETGNGRGTVTYRLRDWLFSRQRYWGEPFPIVYDEHGLPVALPESMLPVTLPEVEDFEPRIVADDAETLPEPPLARAEHWVTVALDLGDGPKTYLRELNTMPQWAGSCWYYLRYLDPTNENELVSPEVERYWMAGVREANGPKGGGRPAPSRMARPPSEPTNTGGVDLYVGGVEHAVLHLLYARFWHKVLYDLEHVSTPEPFQRLFNQGYIQAAAYVDERGFYVEASGVEKRGEQFFFEGKPVTAEYGKMGKSLRNMVTPDDIYAEYGADTLRLYEMFMGPLDASRPWSTTDIVGVHRFLQRLWRNVIDEETGETRVGDESADEETRRLLHRTIAAVRADMDALSFNTAIARLFELNNRLTEVVSETGAAPREVVAPMALMAAPLAPHVGEELWERLGHPDSLAFEPFPEADAALLVEEEIEIAVQVNGKVRARITIAAGATDADVEAAARAHEQVSAQLDGKKVAKVVVVPGRLVNFVLG